MELSLGFFSTKIAAIYPDTRMIRVGEPSRAYSSVGVVSPALHPAEGVLYVDLCGDAPQEGSESRESASQNVGEFRACASRGAFGVVVSASRASAYPGCDLIVVPDDIDMRDVFGLISEAFVVYIRWSDDIYEAVARNADLQRLIDLTRQVVHNPMYIADVSHKMLAWYGGEELVGNADSAGRDAREDDMAATIPMWSFQLKYGYYPSYTLKKLTETGEIGYFTRPGKAVKVVDSRCFPIPYISKSIYQNGRYYGNFFIIEFYDELDECDLEIAEHLGTVLSSAVYAGKSYLETSTLYHMHFMEDIIMGTMTDRVLIENQLSTFSWDIEGDYLLALVDTAGENATIASQVASVLNADINAQCLIHEGRVVAVMADVGAHRESIGKELERIVKTYDCTVAVSERFIDFATLGSYHEQASFALSCAKREGEVATLVEYRRFFSRHVDELCAALPEYAPVTLLKRYDAEHGTELCRTLYVWLTCERNTLQAARVLFIHRNTLTFRIGKIQDVAKLDLDDCEVRMRLIQSLGSHERSTSRLRELG